MPCDPETKQFLLTLLDIIEDLGPEGVDDLCFKGGSTCQINKDLPSSVSKARELINKMEC